MNPYVLDNFEPKNQQVVAKSLQNKISQDSLGHVLSGFIWA